MSIIHDITDRLREAARNRATRAARAAHDEHAGDALVYQSGPTPYWRRYVYPTREPAEALAQLPMGRIPLPSGREVFNTGQLLIGTRHQNAAAWRDQGVYADQWQERLLDTRESPITHVGSSFGARLANLAWWVVGVAAVAALIVMAFNAPEAAW